jgi:hypothetical protein
MGDQLDARPVSTHSATERENKHTQTPLPGVGFKPTTPVFVWVKTVHDSDRAVPAIGGFAYTIWAITNGDPLLRVIGPKTLDTADATVLAQRRGQATAHSPGTRQMQRF